MAGKVTLLLWAQTLGLAGAQTTQLLVEPPWTPPVLWDRVTLTCQGSGTAGATTWYKDGQRLRLQGPDRFRVTESGTYQCDRPGTGRSPPVSVLDDWLVLQVPARALLEGDTVTLRCRGWKDKPVTEVRFYRDGNDLGNSLWDPELSLSPLQLNNAGRYRCWGSLKYWSTLSKVSAPVTVTVHELFPVPVLEGPPEPTEGSPLNLSCLSTPSPLRPRAPLLHLFYRDGQLVGGPQGSPQLLLPAVGVSHSGSYSCEVRSEWGTVRKSSARLRVTVRSECGDGRGEPRQPPRDPCLGTPSPAWGPPSTPDTCPESPHPFSGPSPGPPALPRVPPSIPGSLPQVPPSVTGSPHPSLGPPQLSLRSSHGPQVPPSPSGSPHPPWCPLPEPPIHPWGPFPSPPPPSFAPLSPSLGSPRPSPTLPASLTVPWCPPPPAGGPGLGGVRVGAAPRGTAGTGGPPGAELRGGRGGQVPCPSPGTGGTRGHLWAPAPAWSCTTLGTMTAATTSAGPATGTVWLRVSP
ncbi:high affinity immunoglobulin gamma Fc receptor I-like isoform 2-T2 [Cyanocitta cristata]